MPRCINDPTKTYTGNEKTPKGKGYIASAENLGKKMKGTDGDMYVVVKNGNGKKWNKAVSKKKQTQLSPMSKRKKEKKEKKEKKQKKEKVKFEEEEYYDSEEEYYDSEDDDLEWKLDAAETRCKLSEVFCTETLLVNVALLAWNYFKDWYRRVQYGEDPYQAYEDVKMLNY